MAKKLSDLTGISEDPPEPTECREVLVNSRKVGVEIEIENCPINRDSFSEYSLLNIKGDNSLRNHGLEITTKPVRGSQIVLALQQVDKFILDLQLRPEDSMRSGLHVHVDMRDCDTKQLVAVLITYLIFEDVLFFQCGERREDNPYCVPVKDVIATVPELRDLLGNSSARILNTITHYEKYSALNLKPLTSLGTIEFRIKQGTHDTEEILHWVNVLLCLVDFGMNHTTSPQDIIDQVCSSPEELFFKVFRETLPFSSIYYDMMLVGARAAQEFFRYRELPVIKDSLLNALHGKEVSPEPKPIPKKRPRPTTSTGRRAVVPPPNEWIVRPATEAPRHAFIIDEPVPDSEEDTISF